MANSKRRDQQDVSEARRNRPTREPARKPGAAQDSSTLIRRAGLGLLTLLAVSAALMLSLRTAEREAVDDAAGETHSAPSAPPQVDLSEAPRPLILAVESALAVLEAEPYSANAWGELAMVYHANGFPDAASGVYVKASELAPKDPRWPYLHGLSKLDLEPARAVDLLRLAAVRGAYRLTTYLHLGRAYLASDAPAEAQEALESALEIDASTASAWLYHGRALMAQDRAEEARDSFQSALEFNPTLGAAQRGLAAALRQMDAPDEATSAEALADSLDERIPFPPDPILTQLEQRRYLPSEQVDD